MSFLSSFFALDVLFLRNFVVLSNRTTLPGGLNVLKVSRQLKSQSPNYPTLWAEVYIVWAPADSTEDNDLLLPMQWWHWWVCAGGGDDRTASPENKEEKRPSCLRKKKLLLGPSVVVVGRSVTIFPPLSRFPSSFFLSPECTSTICDGNKWFRRKEYFDLVD